MKWECVSPSNLALIKYMGKKPSKDDGDQNIPLNSSLSYTLNHFVTKVTLEESKDTQDEWRPYEKNPFYYDSSYIYEESLDSKNTSANKYYKTSKELHLDKNLSNENQKKFLNFFKFLKKKFFIPDHYIIRSVNNFPLSAGAASSASSFSSLTLAAYHLAKDRSNKRDFIDSLTKENLSEISRLGSGSSCRSFFSPWSLWQEKFAKSYQCPFTHLFHQLIVIDKNPKSVSSREAHQRILKSSQFKGRVDRAEMRLQKLSQDLNTQNWKSCFEIVWEEFEDMHDLFASSQPAFKYKNQTSDSVLHELKQFWKSKKDGPLVTMDAGTNIHLLYRKDQVSLMKEIEDLFSSHLILSSNIE